MKVKIKCGVCDKVIASIEKDVVTSEDVNLYKATTSCDEHQQENIIVEVLAPDSQ